MLCQHQLSTTRSTFADYELLIAEPLLKEYRRFYGDGKTIDDFME